ncbi:MAG: hypothetical protein RR382_04290 [Tannerellaceae bacterium]
MILTDKQRIAICCVLLDIAKSCHCTASLSNSPRFDTLRELTEIAPADFAAATQVSVIASLAVLKEIHYKLKMVLGLLVCEYISNSSITAVESHITFDVLMSAIDWKISFSEMMAISKTH